jgi:hypothetical protein
MRASESKAQWQLYDSSAVEFDVPTRACRANDRNFKFTALGAGTFVIAAAYPRQSTLTGYQCRVTGDMLLVFVREEDVWESIVAALTSAAPLARGDHGKIKPA